MRGVFDDQQLEPVQSRQDTEFTLGSGTLLLIFFGLVLLCGLCFGLGYTFGRRSPSPAASVIQPRAAQNSLESSASSSKPSATADSTSTPAAPPQDATQPADAQPGGAAAVPAVAPASAPAAAPSAAPGQSPVHAALAAAPTASAAPPTPQSVQPALAPAVSLMVQIAAVSNVEDADVLVSALRRHGYAVTARREPADNLIHVRIGPFATREDALRWRQKLLDDGYNAVVQP